MTLSRRFPMPDSLIYAKHLSPSPPILSKAEAFLKAFKPLETASGTKLLLHFDERSRAYYVCCHLSANVLTAHCDTEATIDPDEEDVIYKLNREITEDQDAYKEMEKDALNGRVFEDIVLEYDTSYRLRKPLKVYGGQHRLRAIAKAQESKPSVYHGVRVYFELSREQKVEIATVNNTSIAVPNDLLDRMREQLLGSELRDWSQQVGLLETGQDFSDRRSPDTLTVRLARTLIVNYHLGMHASAIEAFHQPTICKSGGLDQEYLNVRACINWSDPSLLTMGTQFGRLHRRQREAVLARDEDSYAEYARKALSLSVVASWAFAAGLFQREPEYLQVHYSIPDSAVSPGDPLNAKALSQARQKGVDPDTYRGLGTRSGPKELGRMLEVFLVLAAKAQKKRINKDLANAAIQSYEAKRAVYEASKVLGKI
jgi:hypothetical protein